MGQPPHDRRRRSPHHRPNPRRDEVIMSIGGRIFAGMYDRMMAGSEQGGLSDQRDALLASATGSVLEIGAGTGANLSRYGSAVASLTLIEPGGSRGKRPGRMAEWG